MKSLKIFIALAVTACFAFMPENDAQKISIVIDAGHGGNDFGATHDNFTEKEITSQIISKIQTLNQSENVDIQFTRLSDNMVSLKERTDIINRIKPDLVISLHVNANKNANTSGVDIFTPDTENPNSGKSAEFAQKLSEKFQKDLNMKIRGIQPAPFHILKKSESPALVVELGYLTNSNDRAYLTDDKSQTRIANTVLEFISGLK